MFIVKDAEQNQQPISPEANMRVVDKWSLFPCQAVAEGYSPITAFRVGSNKLTLPAQKNNLLWLMGLLKLHISYS